MTTTQASPPRLARRRLGVISLIFFTVAASAPLTVLGGGVTTTYAVTGIAGVPLSFILLGAALALFVVGYAAMSRYVANAGAFYSYLAQGLGRESAVGGAFVALARVIRAVASTAHRRHVDGEFSPPGLTSPHRAYNGGRYSR